MLRTQAVVTVMLSRKQPSETEDTLSCQLQEDFVPEVRELASEKIESENHRIMIAGTNHDRDCGKCLVN